MQHMLPPHLSMYAFGLIVLHFVRLSNACMCEAAISQLCIRPARNNFCHTRTHISAQVCRISLLKPSITSSSSTLHVTPIAASLHWLVAMQLRVERELSADGIRDGMGPRAHYREGMAVGRHAHSLQQRSADTFVRRYSPPTVLIALSTTLTYCQRCREKQARRYPSAHCNNTGRRS